jgi:hypothetical protein
MIVEPLGQPFVTLEDLRLALRDRAEALNISRETLDAAAGLAAGHASKILAPRPLKRIGGTTLPLLLGALGLQLVLIEDRKALGRIASRLEPREVRVGVRSLRWGKAGIEVSKRWVKRIAAEGGRARARSLSPAKRRKSARLAAKARWARVKEAA